MASAYQEAYINDKGIKAVLEAAINVDRPIVHLRVSFETHTDRARRRTRSMTEAA
jgi:hypothetical protein